MGAWSMSSFDNGVCQDFPVSLSHRHNLESFSTSVLLFRRTDVTPVFISLSRWRVSWSVLPCRGPTFPLVTRDGGGRVVGGRSRGPSVSWSLGPLRQVPPVGGRRVSRLVSLSDPLSPCLPHSGGYRTSVVRLVSHPGLPSHVPCKILVVPPGTLVLLPYIFRSTNCVPSPSTTPWYVQDVSDTENTILHSTSTTTSQNSSPPCTSTHLLSRSPQMLPLPTSSSLQCRLPVYPLTIKLYSTIVVSNTRPNYFN